MNRHDYLIKCKLPAVDDGWVLENDHWYYFDKEIVLIMADTPTGNTHIDEREYWIVLDHEPYTDRKIIKGRECTMLREGWAEGTVEEGRAEVKQYYIDRKIQIAERAQEERDNW